MNWKAQDVMERRDEYHRRADGALILLRQFGTGQFALISETKHTLGPTHDAALMAYWLNLAEAEPTGMPFECGAAWPEDKGQVAPC